MAASHSNEEPGRRERRLTRWVVLLAVPLTVVAGLLLLRDRSVAKYEGPIRHVIFISLDTTRADHLGCYGNTWISTPALDALARESVLLTNYMTVVPTTLASHTTLFSGKYPHSHGTPRNGFIVNDDNVMLAEILRDVGFHTAGFLGSFALDSRFNFAQGFDHYDETFERFVGQKGAVQNERSAAAVTDAVAAYLSKTDLPSHLFLFVHYFDPHEPYAPPGRYDGMYEGGRKGKALDLVETRKQLIQAPQSPKAQALAKTAAAAYAGEVSYMDEHVGRLVNDLRARGILDESLLVITSDHGENLADHPAFFNHGRTLYQSTVHGVCMIRLPKGERGGTRLEPLAANIDVLPTVLRLLGLPIPSGIDGEAIDLKRDASPSKPRVRFAEASRPHGGVENGLRWRNGLKSRCLRTGQWKFIHTPYLQREELYDLSADPSEQHNLLNRRSAEITAKAEAFRRELDAWNRFALPLASRFEPSQRQETMERLRSMGYLSPP